MTRREFLKAGAAVALLLPLAACGGAAGPVSKAPADTLVVAVSALEPGLDPLGWSGSTGPRTFAPMFDALTFVQNDGQLRPALAIAWSQTKLDTWQFRLRVADAKFHNGEFFGPESVQLTIERLLDPANRLPLRRAVDAIQKVEIVDPATVNLVTSEPVADLPKRLSLVYMLPPRYFAQVGAAAFAQQPIGTGFWQLQDFTPGKQLNLSLFRDTWRAARGTDPPPLKKLQLPIIASAADRAQALRALQVDIATQLQPDQANSLKTNGFLTATASFSPDELRWQRQVLGAQLGEPVDVLATAANVKELVAEPNGSWWYDRVTKTEMQRVAVAGGA